ncbi:MAG: hypothetical protein PQJ60_04165 [Spirochaetales bacterium]|nr:hypothetical protein [Spirochaetales bacterium]
MKQLLATALFTVMMISPLFSDQLYLEEGDYCINIPVLWDLYDSSNVQDLSFISDDQTILLQVSWYEGSQFDDVNDMYRYFADGIGAEKLDQSVFPYLDWDSLLADASFESGGNIFRGWFLFLEGERFDYQVIAFSPEGDYEKSFPYILSCLDSFAPGKEGRRRPGVISQLFYSADNAVYEKKTDYLAGKAFIYDFDPFELEASQVVIEREAPLLTKFSSGSAEGALAWDRYYKLIYRDNYHRMMPVYKALEPHLAGKSDLEKAEILLAWLQSFEYGSSGTFSDLLSPLASVVNGIGDCDSLALAYLILLDYFGIDGVLMVSEVYSHAMAAVSVEHGGSTILYGDENFVVAEMTEEVSLGMIPADMADLAGWQIISFSE